MNRLVIVLLSVSLAGLCSPGQEKAEEIKQTVVNLKAKVSALQAQIAVLEAELKQQSSSPGPGRFAATERTEKAAPGARARCTAVTQKGTRCTRSAVARKRNCWQH